MLTEHPLRRELTATIVANDVVNSQGVTFVSRLVAETGATPAEVVRARLIARDVTGAADRWDDVEALDGKIDPEVQNELMTGWTGWWRPRRAGTSSGRPPCGGSARPWNGRGRTSASCPP